MIDLKRTIDRIRSYITGCPCGYIWVQQSPRKPGRIVCCPACHRRGRPMAPQVPVYVTRGREGVGVMVMLPDGDILTIPETIHRMTDEVIMEMIQEEGVRRIDTDD